MKNEDQVPSEDGKDVYSNEPRHKPNETLAKMSVLILLAILALSWYSLGVILIKYLSGLDIQIEN